MKVRWTPQAIADRLAVWEYLVERDPRAALRIDKAIDDTVSRLIDFPRSGHVGSVPGTRELHPHSSYRIVYEIVNDVVWILVIVHTARQWPPIVE